MFLYLDKSVILVLKKLMTGYVKKSGRYDTRFLSKERVNNGRKVDEMAKNCPKIRFKTLELMAFCDRGATRGDIPPVYRVGLVFEAQLSYLHVSVKLLIEAL